MNTVHTGRFDAALRRLIAAVLIGGIMGILDGTMVAVAADILAGRFGASLGTVGWVSTAYLLALVTAIPVTSWAVGRAGGRRLWLGGLALFLAGSLASALAWDIGSLIVFRVVQGLGAGIIDPLVLVLLARAAGLARAGRVMGLMGLILSLGPVAGPIVGGIVLDTLGWRWMFLINLPVGLVALLLARRALPGDSPGEDAPRVRLDVAGLALLAPAFAAGIVGLSRATGHAAWQALVPLAAGAVLIAGYAVRALRVRRTAPIIDVRMFRSAPFTASVTVMLLTGLGTFAAIFMLPLYYQQALGHSALVAGLLVTPVGLGGAAAMPLAGRLSDRVGSRTLAQGGAVLALAGMLGFTRTTAGSGEAWTCLAALAVGIGLGCVGAPTMGALYRTLPPEMVPQGSSALYMLNQLGASIGIAVVALIMQGADGPMDGFRGVAWFGAGTVALLLAGTVLLPGRLRPAPVEVPVAARR
ncbi:DHA2 family efflux MFS transporter permease subunit [Actinomadura violacea]|uniref:DHA2 family efflux MFS transporter permease subunit n=1 Tax=Actinomadura violacea TaxID=2819934 RepID=A0ABS3S7Z1_9ACTN|nr:DHA2 family efflux MFS transporter permease subunit [Actinomadura violacea]MBO2465127.1 DHA2 family efflux MFS transporter permease subunit [Actinomadura violacea]